MKSLIKILSFAAFTAVSAQQTEFRVNDVLFLTKMSKDQLESKFNLKPLSAKGKETTYEVEMEKAPYTMTVTQPTDRIKKATLVTRDLVNEFCGQLMYTLHSAGAKKQEMVMINNATKKSIPYFSYTDFVEAKNKEGALKDNTSSIIFIADGINFNIRRTDDKCIIETEQK